MNRARYETFLGGRLLKVTEQLYVGSGVATAAADPGEASRYVDGGFWWEVDETRISEDVAQAMLASAGQFTGPPYHGLPISDYRLIWLLVSRSGPVTVDDAAVARVPRRVRVAVSRREDGPPGWTLEARP